MIIQTIANIVKTIVVLSLLTLFLEMMLPMGKLKNLCQMVMGLLVLASILNPILDVLGQEWQIPVIADAYQDETDRVLQQGGDISQQLANLAADNYQQDLEKQMMALVQMMPGVQDGNIDVVIDVEIADKQIKKIVVQNVGDISLQEQITATLSGFYGVESKYISYL